MEFPSVNAAAETELHPGFQRIIETIHVKDPEATHDKLLAFLRPREGGRTKRDLDEAPYLYRKAHDLYMTAKAERARWELDNDVVFAAMKERAALDLQREKEGGERRKQITDADITTRIALLFPSEWKHQEQKRRAVKNMEDSMANLVAVFETVCRTMPAVLR